MLIRSYNCKVLVPINIFFTEWSKRIELRKHINIHDFWLGFWAVFNEINLAACCSGWRARRTRRSGVCSSRWGGGNREVESSSVDLFWIYFFLKCYLIFEDSSGHSISKAKNWPRNWELSILLSAGVAGPDKGSAARAGGHEGGEVKGESRLDHRCFDSTFHWIRIQILNRQKAENPTPDPGTES